MLVLLTLPRLEPSAMNGKAAVEEPIFVKPLVAIVKKTAATIPIDEGRKLFAEGLVAFAKGDIATARAFFVSAAAAGDARALVALGDTFDPATLTRLGVVGLKGDEAKARDYYSRAVSAGAPGARERVASLASK
jgi:TPR repeat protein